MRLCLYEYKAFNGESLANSGWVLMEYEYFIALDRIKTGDTALSFDVPIIANVSFRDNVYS